MLILSWIAGLLTIFTQMWREEREAAKTRAKNAPPFEDDG